MDEQQENTNGEYIDYICDFDPFGLKIENKQDNGLICPNCKESLHFDGKTFYQGYNYDKWVCEGCSHIIVLDWRDKK